MKRPIGDFATELYAIMREINDLLQKYRYAVIDQPAGIAAVLRDHPDLNARWLRMCQEGSDIEEEVGLEEAKRMLDAWLIANPQGDKPVAV